VDAERLSGTGRLRAEKVLDASRVETAVVAGYPAGVLVRESHQASLVVVGHPARGKAREYVTGSVAFAVTAHSACDVIVVPDQELVVPGPQHPVVVGHDGSGGADRATRRAAAIAVEHGAPLVLVRALPRVEDWFGPPRGLDALRGNPDGFRRLVRDALETIAADLRAGFPGLDVRGRVVDAHPVAALLEVAEGAGEGAGLLVVGCRGLGGFERLLLGSVSRAVVHYARTPVRVVRPDIVARAVPAGGFAQAGSVRMEEEP
jgi:nucleotide-binding universal stress UspA family protein